MTRADGIEDRIETVARGWVLYVHSGDAAPEKLAELEAWLAADDAHARAYLAYEQLMDDLTLVPELGQVEISPVARPDIAGAAMAARSDRWLTQMAAGLVLAITILGGGLLLKYTLLADPAALDEAGYETMIAEIRDIRLEDGSLVTLGARSRIEADFTDTMRVVNLLEGEAFFDVVSDPERPFYVGAGDRLIRVVGTRFDVRQAQGTVRISVVEGVVEVLKAADPREAEERRPELAKDVLKAGDEVVARIGSEEIMHNVIEPEKAAAWRRGWLSYEDASLAEIVADTNRYSARQIVFASPDLEALRVTAAFGNDQVDQFVLGLEATYGLLADHSDPERILLSRPE